MMSLRLRVTAAASRLFFKPWVARATDPVVVREAFRRHARRQHLAPPFMACRSGRLGDIPAQWVSCGPVDGPEVIFYIHGGGFVVGHPETHQHIVADLCARLRCEAVMPIYRLAPEHPFPAGFEDIRDAYLALVDSGRPPGRIVLMGDSAGGNLVMALLGWLNAEGLPMPRAAVPISPVLDLANQAESLKTNAHSEAILVAARFDELCEMYLQGAPHDDPRASPLRANYPNLPPTLFHVCEDEILRDDTLEMQARLVAQGHDPLVRSWPGGLHVFHLMRGWIPEADRALEDIANWIKELRTQRDS